jgi:hypothetical protein
MAKPEKSFRVGPISASVFVNEPNGKAKRPFSTVRLELRYNDTFLSDTLCRQPVRCSSS